MDEIDLKDQIAALVKEIRAQTAKMAIVSAKVERVTAELDGFIVKPVTAFDPSSPTSTTSMVSRVDVHDAVPPPSGQFSVSSSSSATSATNGMVSTELANDNDAGEHCDDSKLSPTAELVTVSARTAESLAFSPARPTSIIRVVPVTCSTKGSSSDTDVLTPASTPAAAPMSSTATVDIIPVLTAAKASDGTFDEDAGKGAASMVTTSSPGSTHSGVYASVFVIIPSLPPSLSLAPTALTATKVSDTRLLQPFSNQMPTVQVENKHYHTPWPPPHQYLSCCDSSKSRPAPWPSFGDLPGRMHLTEPRPSFTSACENESQEHSRLPPLAAYPSLVQWKPRHSKELTCVATMNLGACLLGNAGMKPIDTSFTAMGSCMLQLVVFSGNGAWWSYYCLSDNQLVQQAKAIFEASTSSLQHCAGISMQHRSGAAPSFLMTDFVKETHVYDVYAEEQDLCCPWSRPAESVLRRNQLIEYDHVTVVADYLTTSMSQNRGATGVLGTDSQEEQFTDPSGILKMLENFLKKPCAEWEEAILSGLINNGTSVLEIWANPGLDFLFRDTTSEEVAPWLSEDNQTAVQHFNDSVPCGVLRSSFALLQWEIAWQLKGSTNYASNNLILDGKEVLVTWSHFLRIHIMAPPSKEISFQTDPMSLQRLHGHVICSARKSLVQKLKKICSLTCVKRSFQPPSCFSATGPLVLLICLYSLQESGPEASIRIDSMKRNKSTRSCRTLILACPEVTTKITVGAELLYYYQPSTFRTAAVLELQQSMYKLFSERTLSGLSTRKVMLGRGRLRHQSEAGSAATTQQAGQPAVPCSPLLDHY